VLFTIWRGVPDASAIAALDLADGSVQVVVEGGYSPKDENGILFFARGERLVWFPFDVEARQASGLVRDLDLLLGTDTRFGGARFDVRGETLAFMPHNRWVTRLALVSRAAGQELEVESLLGTGDDVTSVAVDPIRRRVAYTNVDGAHADLWILDLETGGTTRRTRESIIASPVWDLTGGRLVYSSNQEGPMNLYVDDMDGSAPRRVWPSTELQFAGSWTPDGGALCFTSLGDDGYSTQILDLGSQSEPRRILSEAEGASSCAISPDGQWIAFTSDKAGLSQIMVARFADEPIGEWTQLTEEGGISPFWDPKGKALYWRNINYLLVRAEKSLGEEGPFLFQEPSPVADHVFYRGSALSDTELVVLAPALLDAEQQEGIRIVVGWRQLLQEG
jgi:dipeptidyl aminopeptidase/acylaminoacyl peptidase